MQVKSIIAAQFLPAFKEVSGLTSRLWLSDEADNVYGGVICL